MQAPDIVFGMALAAVLAAIAIVDLRRLIIPDILNLALGALGLAWSWTALGTFPAAQVGFALALMALFWLMRVAYLRLRGVVALGLGDVKMAGAAALWFSPWNLSLFLFLTAVSALLFVAIQASVTGALDRGARVPFGPFLGLGLFATWLIERSNVTTFIPDRGF